jgi:hypothetical protein
MSHEPRILLYDIENSPILAHVWRRWNIDNVTHVEEDWHLLSVGWKWLGERTTHCQILPDFARTYGQNPANDIDLAWLLHDLFDEADIVIAHNGKRFDQRKAKARMLVHAIPPPSPFKAIDTLKIIQAEFALSSNKLDDVCRQLGLPGKVATGGYATWLGCMAGDTTAWERMRRYNKQDVRALEGLYYEILPWIQRHPNMGVLMGDSEAAGRPDICPKCGVESTMISRGWSINSATRRRNYWCAPNRGGCGGYSQGRVLEKSPVTFTN